MERDHYAAQWHQLSADVVALGERLYSISLSSDTPETAELAAQECAAVNA
ncbi:hypothetical protein BVRB_038310, partial [Beta vulgaris subsp. vulgaris]